MTWDFRKDIFKAYSPEERQRWHEMFSRSIAFNDCCEGDAGTGYGCSGCVFHLGRCNSDSRQARFKAWEDAMRSVKREQCSLFDDDDKEATTSCPAH